MITDVRIIPFFKDLSDRELAAIRPCLRERTFKKGENLFLEGNVCDRVFFVKHGRIKMYRIGSTGREQILETLGPGDTCACNPGERDWQCGTSAEAVTDCTVWFLSRDHYLNLVKTHTELSRALNRLFAERLKCFSSLIEEVSLKDSKKRLVKFLLDILGENKGSKGALTLTFTREELAQRIGMARETAARQLADLKRRRLIDVRARQIVILNQQGLQKLLE
ncbi:MAG: hypothetical protein A3D28_06055 [Omnitrophica bacterium RIFCSPHIGHO2_02_FULL_63_14]|nr:MAG: hypothetical protein A3D28_06055 [Omnitrophica bacterium RIFCSPHIGHO2_02_FULL_63_14]